MTTIQLFWLILGTTWAAIEIVIALKTRVTLLRGSNLDYRSERLIWLVVAIALILALWVKQMHWAVLPIDLFNRQLAAITFFTIGLAVRCYAVLSLGKFFSTTVTTYAQHILIVDGPYRYVRHPAYTGLFMSFFAAGFAMGDALALLALMAPIGYVLNQRIRVEEQRLNEHFGKAYDDYSLRTKKLLPWIY
jgi:protein-S-isoprenylcysteine O-methyltransferase Ste14